MFVQFRGCKTLVKLGTFQIKDLILVLIKARKVSLLGVFPQKTIYKPIPFSFLGLELFQRTCAPRHCGWCSGTHLDKNPLRVTDSVRLVGSMRIIPSDSASDCQIAAQSMKECLPRIKSNTRDYTQPQWWLFALYSIQWEPIKSITGNGGFIHVSIQPLFLRAQHAYYRKCVNPACAASRPFS